MNSFKVILPAATALLLTVAASAAEGGPLPTNAPARIELRDEYDAPQTLSFPATNLPVPSIADMAGVPGPWRNGIRKKFQKLHSHPVMLDWSGGTSKAFACERDKANVFLLDRQSRILLRFAGEADDAAVRELSAGIDSAAK